MLREVTPNPIAEPIKYGSLTLKLEEFSQLPTTRVTGGPVAHILSLKSANDGSGNLFVNDSRGVIWRLDSTGQVAAMPFLDVRNLDIDFYTPFEPTTGLRSFAFHPDFENPGTGGYRKLYTTTTHTPESVEDSSAVFFQTGLLLGSEKSSHHDVISEWQVFEDDFTQVDPSTRREIIRIEQPESSGGGSGGVQHNVGEVTFDPHARPGDPTYGLLYFSTGDGAADRSIGVSVPRGTPQNFGEVFGKVLRINPLAGEDGSPYTIPSDNPFVNKAGALPEIWALGLRHPQLMSFDMGGDGKLLAGDIGQKNIEEINVIESGLNYGWQVREGTFVTDPDDNSKLYAAPDSDPDYTAPVAQYDHEDVTSSLGFSAVAGGYVYRGSDVPELYGQYIFGDLVSGRVFHVPVDQLNLGEQADIQEVRLVEGEALTTYLEILNQPRADLRFGQDESGEVYFLTKQDGTVRRASFVDELVIAETGTVDSLDHSPVTITLENDFIDPVVIVSPLSYNNSDPAEVRILDVQGDQFTFRVQEPNYLDYRHDAQESITYMVVEAGSWVLADGTQIQAGNVDTHRLPKLDGFESIQFENSFDVTPAIFSQVQSINGGDWVRTRQRFASDNGFQLAMEEEELLQRSGHTVEEVGWLAFGSGSGTWDGLAYTAGHTDDLINHSFSGIEFNQGFTEAPGFLAQIASYDGADPAGLRFQGLSADGVQIKIEEETSFDAEISHTTEIVDYFAIQGSGLLTGKAAGDPFANSNQAASFLAGDAVFASDLGSTAMSF